MNEVDFRKPLEARSGQGLDEVIIVLDGQLRLNFNRFWPMIIDTPFVGTGHLFINFDGGATEGGADVDWRITNQGQALAIHPTTTIPTALYERMVGLIMWLGAKDHFKRTRGKAWAEDEAREIAKELQPVADPDEALAKIMFDAAYPNNKAWDVQEVRRGWIEGAKTARRQLERGE